MLLDHNRRSVSEPVTRSATWAALTNKVACPPGATLADVDCDCVGVGCKTLRAILSHLAGKLSQDILAEYPELERKDPRSPDTVGQDPASHLDPEGQAMHHKAFLIWMSPWS